MTILDNSEQDLLQLWSLIAELSDQLNQNRSLSVSLHAQAGSIKVSSQLGVINVQPHTGQRRIRLFILKRGLSCGGTFDVLYPYMMSH